MEVKEKEVEGVLAKTNDDQEIKIESGMKVEVEIKEEEDDKDKKSFQASTENSQPTSSNPASTTSETPLHIKEELDPVYMCDECGLTVDGEEELKEHYVTSHLPANDKRFKVEEGDSEGDVICQSCGSRFSCLKELRNHFKTEHFVVEETRVEEPLEIPASASPELKEKIAGIIDMMADQRRRNPQLFRSVRRRCALKPTLTDPMKALLKDIGTLIKREFPVGESRRNEIDIGEA